MHNRCNYEVDAFADIPKFDSNDLTQKLNNVRYLVAVQFKNCKRYRIMIGMLTDNCWSVGDVEDAFDLYMDDIRDIKVMLIPL